MAFFVWCLWCFRRLIHSGAAQINLVAHWSLQFINCKCSEALALEVYAFVDVVSTQCKSMCSFEVKLINNVTGGQMKEREESVAMLFMLVP